MIGVGVITFDREKQFHRIMQSIKKVDHIVAVKDYGGPTYQNAPIYDFVRMNQNRGVGACKNIAIQHLLGKGCEHIFLLEDDCMVKDPKVWEYCIEFSKESGLLHFNWDDYRHSPFASAQFVTRMAILSHQTEANFSYFHRDFLKDVRFDEKYINAWEHVDVMLQGHSKGFLPPFRVFISPADLHKYLEVIDGGESTISGKDQHTERVIAGHHYFRDKWGKPINEMVPPTMDEFYEAMKAITIKYGKRN